MNRIQVVDYGTCGPCRKRCPEDPKVWHVGHMSWNVVKGRITQREIYGR